MWRKVTPCTLLVGLEIVAGTMENSMEVSQKAKDRTIIWSINNSPRYISGEKNKNTNSKRYIKPKVQSSTVDNGPDMKANQMFMNKWIKTIWCVCTVECYTAIKKQSSALQQCGWTSRILCLMKTDKNTFCGIIYMWNLKLQLCR